MSAYRQAGGRFTAFREVHSGPFGSLISSHPTSLSTQDRTFLVTSRPRLLADTSSSLPSREPQSSASASASNAFPASPLMHPLHSPLSAARLRSARLGLPPPLLSHDRDHDHDHVRARDHARRTRQTVLTPIKTFPECCLCAVRLSGCADAVRCMYCSLKRGMERVCYNKRGSVMTEREEEGVDVDVGREPGEATATAKATDVVCDERQGMKKNCGKECEVERAVPGSRDEDLLHEVRRWLERWWTDAKEREESPAGRSIEHRDLLSSSLVEHHEPSTWEPVRDHRACLEDRGRFRVLACSCSSPYPYPRSRAFSSRPVVVVLPLPFTGRSGTRR